MDSTVRLPWLERVGIRYFHKLSGGVPVDAGDGVHILNPEERRGLRHIERWTVVRACSAGALSTLVSAGAEVWAQPLLGPHADQASLSQNLQFWAIVVGATGFASVIEILYLYWDALRAVHNLAHVAGLDLFPNGGEDVERAAVAGAMARAALELPNPTGEIFGVNPHREASSFRLLAASFFYKAKISVTNFLIKGLVLRMLGRTLVRSWLPFVAVPVTAAWNGVVGWLIMREARIRAMGPSAAKEMVSSILDEQPSLSRDGRIAVIRAVGSCIVRKHDLHPNLVALLAEVFERLGGADTETIDDSRLFLEHLRHVGPEEQRLVLRMLTVGAVIDGRLNATEKRLIAEAQVACGLTPNPEPASSLRRAFVQGDPIPRETLSALA